MDKSTISAVMRAMGRKGGKAKVAKGFAALSPEERQKVAKKAVRARQTKAKEAKKKEAKKKVE